MAMSYRRWTRNGFTIQDKDHLSTSMGEICMEEMYSDIVLICGEGVRYPAHRAFLAARSDYFSKLLYGGLKETTEKEVKIMCSDEIIKPVLQFLYGGVVKITPDDDLDYLMNLLNEVRLMCIDNLRDALEDLIIDHFINKPGNDTSLKHYPLLHRNSIKKVTEILNTGAEKDLPKLTEAASLFLEKHIDEIFNCPDLLNNFSSLGLKSFISSDELDVPEIEIFTGVLNWMEANINSEENVINLEEKKAILEEVRLDQMTSKQLTKKVWPSGLFRDAEILGAIEKQQDWESNNLNSRNVIINQNICLKSMGARVVKADKAEKSDNVDVIIDGKTNADDYDCRRGYAMRRFGERLEVELPLKQKINKVKILLYDRDNPDISEYNTYYKSVRRYYSYRIESSMDQVNWEVIADFSNYKGRSWQTIYFSEKRIKYIGIVGVKEHREYGGTRFDRTPENHIHVVSIEAMLDTNSEDEDRKNSGMFKS